MKIKNSLVFSILSVDRPGVVEIVAGLVAENGGNWEESHLASMGGFFGGIVHVTVPAEAAVRLAETLESLAAEGVLVKSRCASDVEEIPVRHASLELLGQDRPGIVSQISEVMATRGVNIEALETRCSSAPMSGVEMFQASARLGLPATVSVDALRTDLERLASDLMVEIRIVSLGD